jgi:hypothetical protein
MIEPKDILFVGLGATPVCWYRCALPAINLGADWVGVYGKPPHTKLQTGLVRRDTRPPDFDDYQVIVLQQPHGQDWQRFIRKLQASGKTVLYEVDDYLHGIEKVKGHHFGKWYTKKRVTQYEICMRMCDGLIVSTEYLGRRYRKFNKRVYVCRNGLDLERYRLTIPERSTVNIGWSGATGHAVPLVQWLNGAVLPVMGEHDRHPVHLPGDVPGCHDDARHRARPGRARQLVRGQVRPALAGGERARHPDHRGSVRLSRDQARGHRLPRQ